MADLQRPFSLGHDPAAAMAADIVEGAHLPVLAAHDECTLADDVEALIVAWLRARR